MSLEGKKPDLDYAPRDPQRRRDRNWRIFWAIVAAICVLPTTYKAGVALSTRLKIDREFRAQMNFVPPVVVYADSRTQKRGTLYSEVFVHERKTPSGKNRL